MHARSSDGPSLTLLTEPQHSYSYMYCSIAMIYPLVCLPLRRSWKVLMAPFWYAKRSSGHPVITRQLSLKERKGTRDVYRTVTDISSLFHYSYISPLRQAAGVRREQDKRAQSTSSQCGTHMISCSAIVPKKVNRVRTMKMGMVALRRTSAFKGPSHRTNRILSCVPKSSHQKAREWGCGYDTGKCYKVKGACELAVMVMCIGKMVRSCSIYVVAYMSIFHLEMSESGLVCILRYLQCYIGRL